MSSKRLGDFVIAARFESAAGVTAVFGPSGSGKTTLVNMIAGLVTPDRGRITLDDSVLFDSTARTNVPPHRRHIGYVFQEGRLFPPLTVAGNLDYGRRMRGLAATPRRRSAWSTCSTSAICSTRRPGKLSGGERQRVAIGRALLMRPRLLLLDEPLASLDTARKREILPYLERLRDETRVPMVYVSHHAAELRRLATLVVRLDGGTRGRDRRHRTARRGRAPTRCCDAICPGRLRGRWRRAWRWRPPCLGRHTQARTDRLRCDPCRKGPGMSRVPACPSHYGLPPSSR